MLLDCQTFNLNGCRHLAIRNRLEAEILTRIEGRNRGNVPGNTLWTAVELHLQGVVVCELAKVNITE
jgi:hypothetical protein